VSIEPTGFSWTVVYVWLFVAQWIFNLGLGAWLYFRKADADNTDAVKAVAQDLADFIHASAKANEGQNVRLSKLETTMKHLPTDSEMSEIRSDVASTKARVEGMSELLRRVEHQTNIIHDHLLRKARA
jgi:uncharacterized protein HemX